MSSLVYFDDLTEGSVHWGTEVVADKDEMLEYARRNDPWPFHIDEEAAKNSSFRGIIASAGYTFSLWCRALHGVYRIPGAEWAFLGGYELHVQLLRPVRPGDRLRLKVTIGSKRPSSKPDRGHVKTHHVLVDPDDQPVFSVDLELLMGVRPRT